MTSPESYTAGVFSFDGSHTTSESINAVDLQPDVLTDFVGQFGYLSGDMELPLEARLPGEFGLMAYRIKADANCGLMFYYLENQVIFASVYLTGREPETETELLDTVRYLLMETDEMEEDPTEEEIDEMLSSPMFPFADVTERPAIIEINFPTEQDESKEAAHAQDMNRHAAAAFFAHVMK
ncbi:MAG: hypothetical protein AB8B55_03915 [Mariniblastus sp.]